jgi:hypothetical protein
MFIERVKKCSKVPIQLSFALFAAGAAENQMRAEAGRDHKYFSRQFFSSRALACSPFSAPEDLQEVHSLFADEKAAPLAAGGTHTHTHGEVFSARVGAYPSLSLSLSLSFRIQLLRRDAPRADKKNTLKLHRERLREMRCRRQRAKLENYYFMPTTLQYLPTTNLIFPLFDRADRRKSCCCI